MTAEPVTPWPPHVVRPALLRQWWRDVTFVHWQVAPEQLRSVLPTSLRPDLFEGAGLVGLVAFRMAHTSVLGLPRVPYLGDFPETNVRLYTVDSIGRRGVVFLSMDAARLIPVLAGHRVLRLPYRWSRMSLRRNGTRVSYRCRHGRLRSAITIETGEAIAEPTALEDFVTARWGIHHRGRYVAAEHPRWPLRRARLLDCRDQLLAAAGFAGLAHQSPVSVLYSPGVPVALGVARSGSAQR
jgi:uncharacterized protein YqjF (DUF2071 family)